MKRDRFASDYEKVRRQAGLDEFPDFDKPPAPDPQRVAIAHAEFRARMDRIAADENKKRTEMMASHDRWSRETTEMLILQEYASLGLQPHRVSENGMLVSLATLIAIGWRVEHNGIQNLLIRPSAPPTPSSTPQDLNT